MAGQREWDPEVLHEKLERIQQEVRGIAEMQKHSEDLDQTRTQVSEIASMLQHQRKHMQEVLDNKEVLSKQLCERDHQIREMGSRLQDVQQRLTGAVEEHKQTKRDLSRVTHELDRAVSSKERLEDEQRSAQEISEANRAYAEQMNQRCQELQKAEQDMSVRLKEAMEEARQAKEEKLPLEAALGQARAELEEASERETWLRGAAGRAARAEQESANLQRASQEHRQALLDLETQLRQERNIAGIVSPGAFLKLAKAYDEDGSIAAENNRLKKVITKMRCDAQQFAGKIEEQDRLIKQLQKSARA